MATSLLYLGPCLGPYSILVTAGSGSVYIYNCCSCCSCCRVTGAAIRVASNIAIGTTCSTAVRTASGISGHSCRYYCGRCCGYSYCENCFRAYCGA